jgi:hypothetical protein
MSSGVAGNEGGWRRDSGEASQGLWRAEKCQEGGGSDEELTAKLHAASTRAERRQWSRSTAASGNKAMAAVEHVRGRAKAKRRLGLGRPGFADLKGDAGWRGWGKSASACGPAGPRAVKHRVHSGHDERKGMVGGPRPSAGVVEGKKEEKENRPLLGRRREEEAKRKWAGG